MDSKFTKAPWKPEVGERLADGGDCWAVDCEEGSIAEVQCPADDAEEVARLIAAAPALYEAAVKVLTDLNARIQNATDKGKPVPVFDGVADLYGAINLATRKQGD